MQTSVARCVLCALKKRLEAIPPEPADDPPVVSIISPADNSEFIPGNDVNFNGTAIDPQDGDISANIAWSSSLDGPLGVGAALVVSTLTAGTHIITASVTDSSGLPGNDVITVVVGSQVFNFDYPERNALLADEWDFIAQPGNRNTENASFLTYNFGGFLRNEITTGNLFAGNNNSVNTIFHNLPPVWNQVTLRLEFIAVGTPTNYGQASLLIYENDDNWLGIRILFNFPTLEFRLQSYREFAASMSPLATVNPWTDTSDFYFRISKSVDNYTVHYSADGISFTPWTVINFAFTNPRVALEGFESGPQSYEVIYKSVVIE